MLSTIEELEKGLLLEYEFNKNEFTTICGNCGKVLNLRRRCKDFDVLVHPAFSGRFLCNLRMLEDVEKGLLSIEKCAEYQSTTTYQIQWLLDHKGEVVEVENYSREEVDEYMKQKPHLKGFVKNKRSS